MEKQFVVSVDGQEVEVDDINVVSANAALAVDRALAELLRLGSVTRGIIPAGSMTFTGAVIAPSPPGFKVVVRAFRAVVSTQASGLVDPLEAVYGIRSAIYPGGTLTLVPSGMTDNHITLIYARLDVAIPDAPVIRYVKDNTDAVSAVSLSPTRSTTVSLGIVTGTTVSGSSGAPYPVLPPDTATSFYIAIGYVTSTGASPTVTISMIEESFVALHVAPAAGGVAMRPASINARHDLVPLEVGFSRIRHRAFIPCSAVGAEQRLLAFDIVNTGAPLEKGTIVPGDNIVDDSIDWRFRVFKMAVAVTNLATSPLPFFSASAGSTYNPPLVWADGQGPTLLMGQSLRPSGNYPIAYIDNVRFPIIPAGQRVTLFVNSATGKLYANMTAGIVNVSIMIMIDASGFIENV